MDFQMPQKANGSVTRGESELMNNSRRALDNSRIKKPIETLRLLCLSRGVSGIYGLGRYILNEI